MADLLREILAEKELILKTLASLDTALGREEKTVVELAGISTFLQNVYSGIENILKRIFKYREISIPDSETSHKDLLDVAVENGIITKDLMLELDRYRAFRHFFVHGYVIRLEEMKLIPLALDLHKVWERFEVGINNFLNNAKNA